MKNCTRKKCMREAKKYKLQNIYDIKNKKLKFSSKKCRKYDEFKDDSIKKNNYYCNCKF